MDQKIRTFIALEITEKSRAQAFQFEQMLAQCGALVKWEPQKKFHITLKFLGEIPNVEVNDVCVEVQRVARELPPFVFGLKGAGAFPNVDKPRSVWLGVDEGREAVIRTARAIDAAMQRMGFPRELHAYIPHMTLGRIKGVNPQLALLSEKIRQYPAIDMGKTNVKHLTVFASQMARSGSTYTVLATAPLLGEGSESD